MEIEAPIVHKTDSVTMLFKKFFKDNILEQIFIESIKYAQLKGNHNFNFDVDTPKVVITDLLINGYVDLLRRSMFYENTANKQNIYVSLCIPIKRFVEVM